VYITVDGEFHWMVPIDIISSADPTKSIYSTVLKEKTTTVTLEGVKPSDWVKVRHIFTLLVLLYLLY